MSSPDVDAAMKRAIAKAARQWEADAKAMFPAWQRITKIPSTATRHVWFDEDWQYGDVVTSPNGTAMIVHESWGLLLRSRHPHDPQIGMVVLLTGRWRKTA